MKTLCEVFRSPKKEGMYLYVKRGEGLTRVPQNLLSVFGVPEPALVLALEPGRKLALADAAAVIAALEEPGYYVQMPPGRRPAAGSRDDDPDALQNALMAPIPRFEA